MQPYCDLFIRLNFFEKFNLAGNTMRVCLIAVAIFRKGLFEYAFSIEQFFDLLLVMIFSLKLSRPFFR